ncbi:PKD domain-containing protein, partial [Vibrio fortis]|uniref:PKD domain-containing protein n=1 Tax=Vibrio fortis TaxID=212667 RepID=UPI002F42CE7E
ITACNGSASDSSPTSGPNNQTPIAIAGINQQVKVNQVVHLDGTRSVDYDNDLISYSWSFSEKPAGSEAQLSSLEAIKPTFVADQIGTYYLSLVVNDGQVNSRPNQVKIVAKPDQDNSPPVVSLTPTYSASLSQSVKLFDTSTDADGDELYRQWKIIDQPDGSQPSLSKYEGKYPDLTADVAGDYVVELTVTDGFLSTKATTTVTFNENHQNRPPIAYSSHAMLAIEGMTIPLSATESSDPDGDPLTFNWFFASTPQGSNATIGNPSAETTSFVADVGGQFAVNVEVSDGEFTDLPYRPTYVRVASLDGPHAKIFLRDETGPLLLPFKEDKSIDLTNDTGAVPEYYTLGSFTFEAVEKDITLTITSASDSKDIVQPIIRTPFGEIAESDVYVIPAGTRETLTLLSPPTHGRTSRVLFGFAWSLNGPNDFTLIERIGSYYDFTSR